MFQPYTIRFLKKSDVLRLVPFYVKVLIYLGNPNPLSKDGKQFSGRLRQLIAKSMTNQLQKESYVDLLPIM